MEEGTRVSTSMIKRRDKESSFGQMVEDMKVAGKMVSNMVLELTHQRVEKPNKVSGKKVKDSIGSQMNNNDSFFNQ